MQVGLVAVWLGLYLGLGVLALPLASRLFRDFADRGAGLAIPLAFAIVGLLTYWLGQFRFDWVTALLGVVGLTTLSGIALWDGVEIDYRRFRTATVVFTLAYLFLILIRLYRPGAFPGGGEKFLDFGLLASLLRATALPPEDMWFAGESVQYYYGGHMLAAVFAMLTDTAPRFAYNTALAGYYAVYVTAAWGLASVIAAELNRSYWVGGAIGAFFVGLASNLSTPARLLVWLLPDSLGTQFAELFGLEIVGLATGAFNFNYWYASRVIHGDVAGNWQLITEFPFFAFLNGDLHGHMMSPAFLLLGAGLAFAYWKRPAGDRRGRLLRLIAIAPIGGLLVLTNTWSAPAVFGIALLALVFAPATPRSLLPQAISSRIDTALSSKPIRTEVSRIVVATGFALGLAVLGAIAVLPFLTGAASGRSVGFLPTPRSNLGGLLLVYGAFLGISASYLVARAQRTQWWRVAVGFAVLLVATAAVRATALVLFVPLLLAGWYLLRTRSDVSFETVLLVGSLGLLVLIEFVYVIEEAGPGRMNTVFKISAQVWALWSVATGAMAAWLVGPNGPRVALAETTARWWQKTKSIRNSTGADSSEAPVEGRSTGKQRLASVLLVGLLISLAIYPALPTMGAIGSAPSNPTLDAHAYIESDHPEEADAIEWLANRSGQPTMVSAPGTEIYRWVNGPSSMTGIPTVAGWVHEVGYRSSEPYWDRVRDVEIIYETSEPKSRMLLLEKYDVTYLYVGPIERDRYGPSDFATEPGITTAYSDGNVTIYRVT
ncbi:DUF2298 domain-containing protein [Halodesulfurarchaeum sp.]|uniref:DUF2298 domain-containing protein n=1 Tax=Halodesulfurarchaeum sp. TaxID=1980530 RepID=UPI001BC32F48|nr:hypothetical protein [Halodesulfurarchaeum sp.]